MMKNNFQNTFSSLLRIMTLQLTRHGVMSVIMLLLVTTSSWGQGTQRIRVSGKVTDTSNNPLIVVSVVEAGTGNGTITNFDGDYELSVNAGNTVRYSYIGYKAVERNMTTSAVINIKIGRAHV